MQSPENWMEDFGTGTLSGGTGIVTIDATFAETVSESADYHVFSDTARRLQGPVRHQPDADQF